MVMGFLHPQGMFWGMDYDSAKPIIYQMMFSEKKGARRRKNQESKQGQKGIIPKNAVEECSSNQRTHANNDTGS